MNAIGTYVVCNKICDFPEQGCNSLCFLAEDRSLGVNIAVKDISEDKLDTDNLDVYFYEARIAALASHPKILPIMYAGFDPEKEIARIATRYLSAGSLQRRIDKSLATHQMFMAPKEVCETCLYVAQGLLHLHTLNIAHLDIKPSNILFDTNMQPVICDFGQSRLLRMPIEAAPSMYAKNFTPEAIQHSVISKLSDIYQFGLLIYRMCNPVGFEDQFRVLIQQGTRAFFDAVVSGRFPDRGNFPIHVPKKMIEICKKCLAVAPQDRYSDFYEIQNAISCVKAMPLPWYPRRQAFIGKSKGRDVEIAVAKNGNSFSIHTTINKRRKSSLCDTNLTEYSCRARVRAIASEV